jgi:hypothetical protein
MFSHQVIQVKQVTSRVNVEYIGVQSIQNQEDGGVYRRDEPLIRLTPHGPAGDPGVPPAVGLAAGAAGDGLIAATFLEGVGNGPRAAILREGGARNVHNVHSPPK